MPLIGGGGHSLNPSSSTNIVVPTGIPHHGSMLNAGHHQNSGPAMTPGAGSY